MRIYLYLINLPINKEMRVEFVLSDIFTQVSKPELSHSDIVFGFALLDNNSYTV